MAMVMLIRRLIIRSRVQHIHPISITTTVIDQCLSGSPSTVDEVVHYWQQ